MILRIDHIGIAVKDVEEAVKIYTDSLGLAVEDIEIVAHRHIKVAIIPVGENRIELIQPMSPDIKLVKFLKEKGEGLHHLALQVDDIDQELEALKSKGVPLLDREPGIGTHQRRVAFLDPEATKIRLELSEKNDGNFKNKRARKNSRLGY